MSSRCTSISRASGSRAIQEPTWRVLVGVGAGVAFIHRDDCEATGNWKLVRRTLGLQAFGINLVDIPPGEQIPEHDETERDQEEVFYILSGTSTVVVDGEDHPASGGCFARLDPEHTRTVRNDGGEPASVLIISAPRSSGYEPIE